jgi:hypothetical protein
MIKMNLVINVLIGLAILAFLVGTLGRFIFGGLWMGNEPVVYWRGAIGFLAFAVTFILIQIRDGKR